MKIVQSKRNPNKFELVPEMTFDELKILLPIPAFLALTELGNGVCDFATYKLINGDLYAFVPQNSQNSRDAWYYFDNSVRRWSDCQNPGEER